MDEPTTALTSKEVDALFGIILDLKARGISTLFVSHKLSEVFRISGRFTVLRNGRVVVTSQPADLDRRSFAKYMTGRDLEDSRFQAGNADAAPVLEVSKLGLRDAFDDVSFTLRAGGNPGDHRPLGIRSSGPCAGALRGPAAGSRRDPREGAARHPPRHPIGDRQRDRLRARGPAVRRADAGALHRRQHRHRAYRHPRLQGHGRQRPQVCRGASLGGRAQDRDPEPGQRGQHALRRQPAARCAREVARNEPRHPDPERPDRRRRHRIQARHSRDSARPREGGHGHHRHLGRHPRDPDELQPDPGDAAGTDRIQLDPATTTEEALAALVAAEPRAQPLDAA